jgi:hypothetical protein
MYMTHTPVGDTHFVSGLGLPDVRTASDPMGSITTPELQTITPWFRNVADRAGMEAVPAQANLWAAFGRETGLRSPPGIPKLEFVARHIGDELAPRLGVSPEDARDFYLLGTRPGQTP